MKTRQEFIAYAKAGFASEAALIQTLREDFPPSRTAHILKMRDLALEIPSLSQERRQKLVLAVLWHDLGYHPSIARTGFHALDGAELLREAGQKELAALVACHSNAPEEAAQRGLPVPAVVRSDTADLLSYLDMHVMQGGHVVSYEERLADIVARYGENTPVARACRLSRQRLAPIFDALERRIDGLAATVQKSCHKPLETAMNTKSGGPSGSPR